MMYVAGTETPHKQRLNNIAMPGKAVADTRTQCLSQTRTYQDTSNAQRNKYVRIKVRLATDNAPYIPTIILIVIPKLMGSGAFQGADTKGPIYIADPTPMTRQKPKPAS